MKLKVLIPAWRVLKFLGESYIFPSLFVIETRVPFSFLKKNKDKSVFLYGYQLCCTLKKDIRINNSPMIILTDRDITHNEILDRLKLTGVIDIMPFGKFDILAQKIQNHITRNNELQNEDKEDKNFTLKKNFNWDFLEIREELIFLAARMAESRDSDILLSLYRMARYSMEIAMAYGLSKERCEEIYLAAPLHDIGNIAIPQNILYSSKEFNQEEKKIIKIHTKAGLKLLPDSQLSLMVTAKEIIGCHHERWDGSGYPDGLIGDKIPESAQIVGLADVFEALSSDRFHREKWTIDSVLREISRLGREKKFSPKLMEAFAKTQTKILKIRTDSCSKKVLK